MPSWNQEASSYFFSSARKSMQKDAAPAEKRDSRQNQLTGVACGTPFGRSKFFISRE
ncbi:MAG: hypothetical protein M3Q36_02625 [bacterium]|nr:hypothetical protein [bacterium]